MDGIADLFMWGRYADYRLIIRLDAHVLSSSFGQMKRLALDDPGHFQQGADRQ